MKLHRLQAVKEALNEKNTKLLFSKILNGYHENKPTIFLEKEMYRFSKNEESDIYFSSEEDDITLYEVTKDCMKKHIIKNNVVISTVYEKRQNGLIISEEERKLSQRKKELFFLQAIRYGFSKEKIEKLFPTEELLSYDIVKIYQKLNQWEQSNFWGMEAEFSHSFRTNLLENGLILTVLMGKNTICLYQNIKGRNCLEKNYHQYQEIGIENVLPQGIIKIEDKMLKLKQKQFVKK